MNTKIKTNCKNCKKHTTYSINKIIHKGKPRKIDFSQFSIKLKDESEAGKVLKKAVQEQPVVELKCHICNEKQSIECHIIKNN